MKLSQPLSASLITQMKGIVDFYYWKDIPVARSWPRVAHQPNSPAQVATRNAMREMFLWRNALPSAIIERWHSQNPSKLLSSEDVLRQQGLHLAHLRALAIPPNITRGTLELNTSPDEDTITLFVDPDDTHNPAEIALTVKRDDATTPHVDWVQTGYKCHKDHYHEPLFEPDFGHYIRSLSSHYDAALQTYTLTVPHDDRPAHIIAESQAARPRRYMLGPIVTAVP